ncbi:DUF616 domain-containing protein [Eubacterium sp. MSJ-13]|uniref:glycosyltransferase domain-containing protein n=1 Tax=Eubacterium sp. MSJ-13 TaxID=2841513 RepID=UPI001C11BA95|nr:glycosyltransferase domain-containing protein [Eubacterium sp. MSJ-13]MBU5477599.1 DUF616 domain-containing protein [Eubacterium sp. MSJ-13]
MKKEKVIIFGTGRASEHYVKADLDSQCFEVLAFSDNNEQKHGELFLGKKIIPPRDIPNVDYDAIIIASNFYKEISEGLITNYNIPKEKIKNRHYRELEKIHERYKKYYEKNGINSNDYREDTLNLNEKVIVYTSITGGFDCLREPEYIDDNFKYICFTDRDDIKSDIWEIKKIKIENNDYNRTAKKYKLFPNKLFPEYKWSIWIDGQLQITGDLRKLVNRYHTKSNMICFLHQVRKSIKDEARICSLLNYDNPDIIEEELESIMSTGFLDDNELIAGGFIVRKHNENDVIDVMNDWWKLICEYSRRDQLSFNYVAWKNKFFFDVTDLNIMDNEYFRRYAHEKIYQGK